MSGRTRPPTSASSSSKESTRITSYPQGQDGKAAIAGELRTTSYKTSAQFDDRGYVTIN